MVSRTLLLELIAMLALLSNTEAVHIPIQNFRCRWQLCRDRLVCGFDQSGPETVWTNIESSLTLDDNTTARCQQAGYNATQIWCLYEGLRETMFDQVNRHTFKLRLEISEEQVEKYNLKLAQMEVPEWNTDKRMNVTHFVPKRPPQLKGFYHDPEKEELHIYWQPLDVWEFCSNDMLYAVNASNGNMASVVGRDFAIFSGWNPKLSANLTVWSENSLGRSWSSNQLIVPILTNAKQRQPQKVFYDDNIKSIRWDHPEDRNNIVGYTLHWCLKSSTNSSNCDAREPMQTMTVGQYRTRFQFGKSMTQYRIAVVANHSDEISGALVWSTPAPAESIAHLVVIVGSAMLIFLALYALCFKIYQKLRKMADIEIELDFPTMETLQKIRHDHSFPLEGAISPERIETVLIKDEYLVKSPAQPDAQTPHPPLPVSSADSKSSSLMVGYTVMNKKLILSNQN